MVTADIVKLAEEYELKQNQGVVYGILKGYAATFSDGTGVHRLMVSTRFTTNAEKDTLMELLNKEDLKGLYNVRKLQIAKKVVYIAFKMGPDTIEKIRTFIDWFFPLLEKYGASKADVCVQCQEQILDEDAHWVLRDGATAFRMHKACADDLKLTVSVQNKSRTVSQDGSLGMGILGAFLGALMGAALWLLLQLIGFYTPIAGMAIGWLTVNGYAFMRGKTSKLRMPIALVFGAFGIFLGLYLAYVIPALGQNGAGFLLSFFRLFADQQFLGEFMGSFILGAIFLVLGTYVSFKSEGRRTTDFVVTDLD